MICDYCKSFLPLGICNKPKNNHNFFNADTIKLLFVDFENNKNIMFLINHNKLKIALNTTVHNYYNLINSSQNFDINLYNEFISYNSSLEIDEFLKKINKLSIFK